MKDVIRLASHAHHYLAVFDKHTQEPLYVGHTMRAAEHGPNRTSTNSRWPATPTTKTTIRPGTECPRADRRGSGQQETSTYTVIDVTVVTMSSIAPGAPESMREYV